MQNCGLIYTLQGEKYVREALVSLESARQIHPGLPAIVFLAGERPAGADLSVFDEVRELPHQEAPMRLKSLIRDSPFERTLYLDGDTLILRPLDGLFAILDRFDLAARQHYTDGTFTRSSGAVPHHWPEFNAGLFAWRRNEATTALFPAWMERFDKLYREAKVESDQVSFREVLWESDLQIADLQPEFNFLPYFATKLNGPVHIIHGRPFDWLKRVGRECATRAEQCGAMEWPEILGSPPGGCDPAIAAEARPCGATDGLEMPDRRAWIPTLGCLRHFAQLTSREKLRFALLGPRLFARWVLGRLGLPISKI